MTNDSYDISKATTANIEIDDYIEEKVFTKEQKVKTKEEREEEKEDKSTSPFVLIIHVQNGK